VKIEKYSKKYLSYPLADIHTSTMQIKHHKPSVVDEHVNIHAATSVTSYIPVLEIQ
jgi:hypothetical protein